MADELAVWLYGDNVATIERVRGRPRLTYTETALNRYALGTPLLSLSLPVDTRQYPQGTVRPFLDGLLPEGESRRAIARDFSVGETDTYGLIAALGRDCAGAIVIQPPGDPAPIQHNTRAADKLDDIELEDLVQNLRSAPLGAGGRVRVSLAGVQEKLILTRMTDGDWGRPVDGTPSTHILKPEIASYPNTVQNEAFCMRFATHLGIPTAAVATTTIGKRELIVVERYDRIVASDGTVERIHQEDFCQATGTSPLDKYQEDGGPSLAQIGAILSSVASPESLDLLFQYVAVNVMVGNGDAHAKNISLLHLPSGEMRLAPLYDVMSTLHYGADRLAMYVDDVRRLDRVERDRLLNESSSWGMRRGRASDMLDALLSRVDEAARLADEETPGLQREVQANLQMQVERLR
jgi:serine/threonine-protein kinase HipA